MTISNHVLLAAVLATGCASVPAVRFENAPVVWQVDDRGDVPVQPSARPYYNSAQAFDHIYADKLLDTMAAQPPRRALDINALGEVPDSTWFTNRIGQTWISPDRVRAGPNHDADPQPYRPWTIVSAKPGGAMPGFVIEDTRGERYLLKLGLGGVERETAAHMIVQRLLWAAGYHVPQDTIVTLRDEDLRIAPDAALDVGSGSKRRLQQKHVDRVLAQVARLPDGRMRGLTSKFLPGKPVGGYPERGVRRDDPNDVIPHEERRSVRGQYVFFAWLAHTDVKESQSVDIWREDPNDPSRHYIEHYLVDFGQALGVMGSNRPDPSDSYAKSFDPKYALMSIVTLGLAPRPGQGADGPDLPGVGRFESAHFNPGRFTASRHYRPFARVDRYDAFWATAILMRFSPAHIRAAVEQGQLSDPRAEDYLVHTLVARQRRTGRYWFSRVNPLDAFTVDESVRGRLRVCAVDLWLFYRLGNDVTTTQYTVTAYSDRGIRLARPHARPAAIDGRVCTEDLPVGSGPEGYTMVALATRRGKKTLDPVWIHVARDAEGSLRVIGIWRE